MDPFSYEIETGPFGPWYIYTDALGRSPATPGGLYQWSLPTDTDEPWADEIYGINRSMIPGDWTPWLRYDDVGAPGHYTGSSLADATIHVRKFVYQKNGTAGGWGNGSNRLLREVMTWTIWFYPKGLVYALSEQVPGTVYPITPLIRMAEFYPALDLSGAYATAKAVVDTQAGTAGQAAEIDAIIVQLESLRTSVDTAEKARLLEYVIQCFLAAVNAINDEWVAVQDGYNEAVRRRLAYVTISDYSCVSPGAFIGYWQGEPTN